MKVSIAPAQGCALEDGKPRGVQRLSRIDSQMNSCNIDHTA
jgi:hypothetical protein